MSRIKYVSFQIFSGFHGQVEILKDQLKVFAQQMEQRTCFWVTSTEE
jgi:hypothetical protein